MQVIANFSLVEVKRIVLAIPKARKNMLLILVKLYLGFLRASTLVERKNSCLLYTS